MAYSIHTIPSFSPISLPYLVSIPNSYITQRIVPLWYIIVLLLFIHLNEYFIVFYENLCHSLLHMCFICLSSSHNHYNIMPSSPSTFVSYCLMIYQFFLLFIYFHEYFTIFYEEKVLFLAFIVQYLHVLHMFYRHGSLFPFSFLYEQ